MKHRRGGVLKTLFGRDSQDTSAGRGLRDPEGLLGSDSVYDSFRRIWATDIHMYRILLRLQGCPGQTPQQRQADLESSGQPLPEPIPRTPLQEAQLLMYVAWAENSRKKRIEMARRALEISPECADGYLLLAKDTAQTENEAIALFEKAVEAGGRSIGPDSFQVPKDQLWGFVEHHAYLRARTCLADALWDMGKESESIDHFLEMVRLDPSDYATVRFRLVCHLMEMDRDAEAAELIDRFPDEESIHWSYGKALLAFRRSGSNGQSDSLLREALERNMRVPIFLWGQRPPLGDEHDPEKRERTADAFGYVVEAVGIWIRTPGAAEWLRDVMAPLVKEKADALSAGDLPRRNKS